MAAYGDVIRHTPPLPLAFEQGETLSDVLQGLGLEGGESRRVIEGLAEHADLRRLKPSDHYLVEYGPDGELMAFELMLAQRGRARVERGGEDWATSWREYERTVRTHSVAGALRGSLEGSIGTAGAPSALTVLLAEVFQWDLDFTRDLRLGDTFEIVYETVYLDGQYDSLGGIVGAIYENRGQRLEAYRFGEDSAYYDAEGRPLRKMFLRSPLRYSRVTSRFSKRRFHPILKRYRPHYGVDYGAPTGTPVRVTASGTVTSVGRDRGGGNTVKVRHPNGYLSAYLHLSRFARGLRSGRYVAQGDVIGYVGATGLATAPHLDYRVQKNGRWIDPLTIKSVPAEPVPSERRAEFFTRRDWARAQLAALDGNARGAASGERVAASGESSRTQAASSGSR